MDLHKEENGQMNLPSSGLEASHGLAKAACSLETAVSDVEDETCESSSFIIAFSLSKAGKN